MKSSRCAAVLVAFVMVISACGGTSSLDELRSQMQTVFQEDRNVDLEDITCGDAVIEPGQQFTCTAGVVDGIGRLRVSVSIDADNAARFQRENALVSLPAVEAQVSEELTSALGVEITVICGDGEASIRVEEVDGTFTCTAGAPDGETRGVEITVNDLSPITNWRLLAA